MEIFNFNKGNGSGINILCKSVKTVARLRNLEADVDAREGAIEEVNDEIKWLESTNVNHCNDTALVNLYRKLEVLYREQEISIIQSVNIVQQDRGIATEV